MSLLAYAALTFVVLGCTACLLWQMWREREWPLDDDYVETSLFSWRKGRRP